MSIYDPILSLTSIETISVGLLGISMPASNFESNYARDLRLFEIERRILRIEKALKLTGLDITSIPFDE
jgi:hypothetical protein